MTGTASLRAGTIVPNTADRTIGRSIFWRHVARQSGFIVASLPVGFAVGVAYRFVFDLTDERTLPNFLRSGLEGAGIALTAWTVQTMFARAPTETRRLVAAPFLTSVLSLGT